jgi:hypothetical protein
LNKERKDVHIIFPRFALPYQRIEAQKAFSATYAIFCSGRGREVNICFEGDEEDEDLAGQSDQ